MNEVWRARCVIVARGGAGGRVRFRRCRSGRGRVAAAGDAAGPALAARADLPAGVPGRGRGLRVHRAASRTGRGPVNLATIRAAITAAIKDAGYLHVPEGRRDHTTPAEALRLHGLD